MKTFHVLTICTLLSFQAAANEFTEAEAESLIQLTFSGCFGGLMKVYSKSYEPAIKEYCQCYAKNIVARSIRDRNFAHPLGREQLSIFEEISDDCLHKSGLKPMPSAR